MDIKIDYKVIDIDLISPNEWNPNVQTDFVFEKELQSIKDHGFIVPVIARRVGERYEIVDGEHRYRAALKLGSTKIPINDLGEVSAARAKTLTILLNELKGRPDSIKMSDLLKQLSDEVGIETLIQQVPYNDSELRHMIGLSDIDWNTVTGDDPTKSLSDSDKKDEDTVYISIKVSQHVKELFDAQMLRFKKVLFPEDKPKHVEDTMPFQAMLELICQVPDDQIE